MCTVLRALCKVAALNILIRPHVLSSMPHNMDLNNTVMYIMTQTVTFRVNPGCLNLTSSGHVEFHNNDYTTIDELLVIKVKHGIFLGPSRRINTEIPTSQVRQT